MKQWKVRFIGLWRDYLTDNLSVSFTRQHVNRGGYHQEIYENLTPSSLARVVRVLREAANE